MPKAVVRVLALGRVSLNLKTFRVIENERVSITDDGAVKCLGGGCSANGVFITLEADRPSARELFEVLRGVRVLEFEVEVSGLPNWLLSRLEFLTGGQISGNATVKYTWRSMPSLEELALVLNDLNLNGVNPY
jgi:hypothetical protein